MTNHNGSVVFFDLGGTLGSPRISFPDGRLERFDAYPFTAPVLQFQRDKGVPCGIISNTGKETRQSMEEVLEKAGIAHFFDPDLLMFSSVEGFDKSSEEIFRIAATRAGKADAADRCVYVGEGRSERQMAIRAGLRVCPHPLLLQEVLLGQRLWYLRLSVPASQANMPWRGYLRVPSLVPVHIDVEHDRTVVYAISTAAEATRLDDLGFLVDRLGSPDAPLTTSLYLFRDDRQMNSGFLRPEGNCAACFGKGEESEWILASTERGLLIALQAGRSVDEFRFRGAAHGHVAKLLPDMSLLEPFGLEQDARPAAFLLAPTMEPRLDETVRDELVTGITPEIITGHVERYTGIQPLVSSNSSRRIVSRHIFHPDNAIAGLALAADLQRLGGPGISVRFHEFAHQGLQLRNVEAEFEGSDSKEVVIVSAHFDSTAGNDDAYHPGTDPAPGADDDASGVAAVLAMARVFGKIAERRKPKRAIRFVLFNSEEHALAGSEAYSKDQAALDAPIVAVYQMDMIAYNLKDPRSFEVHAGYAPSEDVERRSLMLAGRIGRVLPDLAANLQPPQIYPDQGAASDREDPADRRSDHGSFHRRGYSACVTSEDYFSGPRSDSPNPEPNPYYHSRKDMVVDPVYAADIARVVAGAAWITANV
jgi:bacterial leucyl aminopeptidase